LFFLIVELKTRLSLTEAAKSFDYAQDEVGCGWRAHLILSGARKGEVEGSGPNVSIYS